MRIFRELAQRGQSAILKIQQRLNNVQHPPPLIGKNQAFGVTQKQRHPQLRFQMADMTA